uniref:Uncharacterized protein n=1 Tax=Cyanoderma ruficeps TaxID=181631 RepID=A0A8C3R957_9PASS
MKKFASTRSLNKILQQCDSSSREYEEIQAVEKKWQLHLAAPLKARGRRCKMPSLFLAAPPPPKRAPSTTLTLRSKSMTAELEELDKLDELLAAAEPALRAELAEADSRAATVKQRPTSRRITPAEISVSRMPGMPGILGIPGDCGMGGNPRVISVRSQECRECREFWEFWESLGRGWDGRVTPTKISLRIQECREFREFWGSVGREWGNGMGGSAHAEISLRIWEFWEFRGSVGWEGTQGSPLSRSA